MGFDPEALADAVERAGAAGSDCFLVARRGQVVGEWYWNGTDPAEGQPVFSVTKSVASTLVGLAQADGLLDIDDRASDHIAAWRGTESEDVTIRHLLANVSGRHWDFFTDYGTLLDARDADEVAVDLGQDAPPGEAWAYNNSAVQALDAVLTDALGGDVAVADWAEERLFAPLGMADTRLAEDDAGNALLYSGLRSTCRDLARFGYLFLRHGSWDGEWVVPAAWVEEAIGAPSTPLNAGYGLLWWLNARGTIVDSTASAPAAGSGIDTDAAGGAPDGTRVGRMIAGAPADLFWAEGLGGQVVMVDPGSETVIVRLAPEQPVDDALLYGPAQAAEVVTEAWAGG